LKIRNLAPRRSVLLSKREPPRGDVRPSDNREPNGTVPRMETEKKIRKKKVLPKKKKLPVVGTTKEKVSSKRLRS